GPVRGDRDAVDGADLERDLLLPGLRVPQPLRRGERAPVRRERRGAAPLNRPLQPPRGDVPELDAKRAHRERAAVRREYERSGGALDVQRAPFRARLRVVQRDRGWIDGGLD